MSNSATIVYLSHGGGPLPLLGDPNHAAMVSHLQSLATEIPKPKQIIVFSAHWETDNVTITSADSHPLLYDYYGFPAESYAIKYPVAAATSLADAVTTAFQKQQMNPQQELVRGYDHGVWVPLKIMYPEADIPVVQVSLLNNLSPADHIAIGKALVSLDLSDTLVIGSGFSFHNMRAFFAPETAETKAMNTDFEAWLQQTLLSEEMSEAARSEQLSQWLKAPHAKYCHPREEHLIPLHVCYGLAQRQADKHYATTILNKQASTFLWHAHR